MYIQAIVNNTVIYNTKVTVILLAKMLRGKLNTDKLKKKVKYQICDKYFITIISKCNKELM